MPDDLTKSVLFTRKQLKALLERKEELDIEKAKLKQDKSEKDQQKKKEDKMIIIKNLLQMSILFDKTRKKCNSFSHSQVKKKIERIETR